MKKQVSLFVKSVKNLVEKNIILDDLKTEHHLIDMKCRELKTEFDGLKVKTFNYPSISRYFITR